jgi:hypothetical protein
MIFFNERREVFYKASARFYYFCARSSKLGVPNVQRIRRGLPAF